VANEPWDAHILVMQGMERLSETVSERNQRREAEIAETLQGEATRHDAAIKNMHRLRALRLERDHKAFRIHHHRDLGRSCDCVSCLSAKILEGTAVACPDSRNLSPKLLTLSMCSKRGRQHTMANDLFIHHAVSGGAERSCPFKSLNEAIHKACALLRTHGPTAIVSIHDNRHVIMGGDEVRKLCEAEQ
jgi:hypothetical protein